MNCWQCGPRGEGEYPWKFVFDRASNRYEKIFLCEHCNMVHLNWQRFKGAYPPIERPCLECGKYPTANFHDLCSHCFDEKYMPGGYRVENGIKGWRKEPITKLPEIGKPMPTPTQEDFE
jgi:hypothetical protein